MLDEPLAFHVWSFVSAAEIDDGHGAWVCDPDHPDILHAQELRFVPDEEKPAGLEFLVGGAVVAAYPAGRVFKVARDDVTIYANPVAEAEAALKDREV